MIYVIQKFRIMLHIPPWLMKVKIQIYDFYILYWQLFPNISFQNNVLVQEKHRRLGWGVIK